MVMIKKWFSPKSLDKDSARKEFILLILLTGTIVLGIIAFIAKLFWYFMYFSSYEGLSPYVILVFLFFFVFLILVLKRGKINLASLLFILFLFLAATYTSYQWGVDSGQGLLMYALVIIISAILINTKFAIFVALLIVISLTYIAQLHLTAQVNPDITWKASLPNMSKVIVFDFTLLVITIVSWLYNREIEKSLKRARASEKELKFERDQLEIKVEERTKELKRTQLEKMTQLYRFAEVGRLTAGFMHDLVGPISLVSLNLHKLNDESQEKEMAHINTLLKRAMNGTKFLENFVLTARKQLQNQEIQKVFSLNKETKHVIQLLSYKINMSRITILFEPTHIVKAYGNPIKFNQIAMNLILNAIDAYDDEQEDNRLVKIMIENKKKTIEFSVRDFGVGIAAENFEKVFDPFFTTKSSDHGTGIGLSITQSIVKQNFGGKIFVRSSKKTGTIFSVRFPINSEKIKQ